MDTEGLEYKVFYKNGKQQLFYGYQGMEQIFCSATLYAIDRVWDSTIERIVQGSKVYVRPQIVFNS